MSLISWMEEFYNSEIEFENMTALEATEHSLRKWEGLRPINLKRHKVTRDSSYILDRAHGLPIDSSSCALCVKFMVEDSQWPSSSDCYKCPLYKVRGEVPCDVRSMDIEYQAPYKLFGETGKAWPMIQWLKKTVALVREEQESTTPPQE